MKPADIYAEVAFVLAVAAAAYVWPPAAFIVAAVMFVALAVIADRRTPPPGDAS